ncbi:MULTISPECIES: hypothetical protein [unclassified Streptomyces]|uniref:hypothetical protein n=1 Tax=unclassified Streptomyces TaxID=2593676 RepID=UPI001319C91D|nr:MULTISPECIES: hypothetical protein [unclassified Streptomyces]MYT29966.1 hypothetical protein [Streptomyces sp. SID8354]
MEKTSGESTPHFSRSIIPVRKKLPTCAAKTVWRWAVLTGEKKPADPHGEQSGVWPEVLAMGGIDFGATPGEGISAH